MGAHTEPFAELRLTGERFDDAHFPVDALHEIIRYQQLIIAAAQATWATEHDGEKPLDSLGESLELSITEIRAGSAISVLERPDSAEHDQLFVESKNQVDRLLHSLESDQLTPENLPAWASTKDFWDFGSSLQPQESIQVQSTSASHRGYITIDRKVRDEKLFPLKRDLERARRTTSSFELIYGKVTELNAENTSFEFELPTGKKVHGRFTEPDMVGTFRKYLDASSQAPLITLAAKVGIRNTEVTKIYNVACAYKPGDQPLTNLFKRLNEISNLKKGWLDGENGQAVSHKIILNASQIVSSLDFQTTIPPRIFPTEDGGILIEWASGDYVANIEVLHNGFEAYYLESGQNSGSCHSYENPKDVIEHVKNWKDTKRAPTSDVSR